MNQLLLQLLKRNRIFFCTAVYLLLTLLVNDNKSFMALSTSFYLILFYLTHSLEKTLLFSFFPFFIFLSIGKTYAEEIVPLNKFYYSISSVQSGVDAAFVISPFFILLLTCIGSFLIFLRRYGWIRLSDTIKLFIAFTLIGFLSSLNTSYYTFYSIVNPFLFAGILIWIIEMRMFFSAISVINQHEIIQELYGQLCTILGFQIFIGVLQVIKGSLLGLFIEKSGGSMISSGDPDAYNLLFTFRPIGLSAHANLMAYQLIDLLVCCIIIYILLYKKKKQTRVLFFVLAISVICMIVITQSRAAYLALFVISISLYVNYQKYFNNYLSLVLKRTSVFMRYIIIFFGFILLIIFVFPRIFSTLDTDLDSMGFSFRREFNSEAIELIQQNFFYGVGPGMFVPANLSIHPLGINYGFPYEVHNHFLLLAAEYGIPATLLYLFGFLMIFKNVPFRGKDKNIIFCAILGLFIIGYFHALERFLPWCMIMLLILEAYEKKDYCE